MQDELASVKCAHANLSSVHMKEVEANDTGSARITEILSRLVSMTNSHSNEVDEKKKTRARLVSLQSQHTVLADELQMEVAEKQDTLEQLAALRAQHTLLVDEHTRLKQLQEQKVTTSSHLSLFFKALQAEHTTLTDKHKKVMEEKAAIVDALQQAHAQIAREQEQLLKTEEALGLLQRQHALLADEHAKEQDEKENKSAHVMELESRLAVLADELQKEVAEKQDTIARLVTLHTQHTSLVVEHTQMKKVDDKEMTTSSHLSLFFKALQSEHTTLTDTHKKVLEEKATTAKELQQAKEKITCEQQQLLKTEKALGLLQQERIVLAEEHTKEVGKKKNQRDALANELSKLQAELERKTAALGKKLEDMTQEHASIMTEERDQVKARLEEMKMQHATTTADLSKAEAALEVLAAELKGANDGLLETQAALQTVRGQWYMREIESVSSLSFSV